MILVDMSSKLRSPELNDFINKCILLLYCNEQCALPPTPVGGGTHIIIYYFSYVEIFTKSLNLGFRYFFAVK